jgi:hypothetical protein
VLLLVLAAEVRSWRGLAAFVAVWASFSIPTPISDPKAAIAVSLARMVVIYAFFLWVVLRRETAAPEAPEDAAAGA